MGLNALQTCMLTWSATTQHIHRAHCQMAIWWRAHLPIVDAPSSKDNFIAESHAYHPQVHSVGGDTTERMFCHCFQAKKRQTPMLFSTTISTRIDLEAMNMSKWGVQIARCSVFCFTMYMIWQQLQACLTQARETEGAWSTWVNWPMALLQNTQQPLQLRKFLIVIKWVHVLKGVGKA